MDAYREHSRRKEDDISGGDFNATTGEAEDRQPPKNDSLFAWFNRGEVDGAVPLLLESEPQPFTTPDALRTGLSAKNRTTSLLMELNWAAFLGRRGHWLLEDALNQHADEIAALATTYTASETKRDDLQDLFQAAQLGLLSWASRNGDLPGLKHLIEHIRPSRLTRHETAVSPDRLRDLLNTPTLFAAFDDAGLLESIFPKQEAVYRHVLNAVNPDIRLLKTLDIHR